MVPITEWARSDKAPPGWKTKTIPLTSDAIIIAAHEALERVAGKIAFLSLAPHPSFCYGAPQR